MNKYTAGDVFERLTILEILKVGHNYKARCICACGAIVTPQLGALGNGRAKSCGCLRREKLAVAGVKHGMSNSIEYRTYKHILERCSNPNCREFQNYGGRGIRCEWGSFSEFFKDMGTRPLGAWIERLDNDGNYSRANCAWVTPRENQKNKRVSKRWIVAGLEFDSSREAALFFGVNTSNVNRWCNGFTRRGIAHPPKQGCYCELKYTPPSSLT